MGKLTVYEGDCVLVRNADSFDPDSPDGCDIAKIVRCYDSGKYVMSEFRLLFSVFKDRSYVIVLWSCISVIIDGSVVIVICYYWSCVSCCIMKL